MITSITLFSVKDLLQQNNYTVIPFLNHYVKILFMKTQNQAPNTRIWVMPSQVTSVDFSHSPVLPRFSETQQAFVLWLQLTKRVMLVIQSHSSSMVWWKEQDSGWRPTYSTSQLFGEPQVLGAYNHFLEDYSEHKINKMQGILPGT